MSEGETKTETITLSLSPTDPNEQWAKFYIQASATMAATKEQLESNEIKSNQNDIQKIYQRILITLDTITKLLFGLSPTRKAQVVVHGGGAIELIVGLVRASNVLQSMDTIPLAKPIILSSLKAIKISVLRNPAGRCRCRSADIFAFLSDILKALLDNNSINKEAEDGMLIEHVFTTLAAICLGDDLNALQASTQFKPFMEKTKSIYKTESNSQQQSTLDQKIQYLQTLFSTIEEEQSKLLSHLENSIIKKESKTTNVYQDFIQNINNAEKNVRYGYSNLKAKSYKQAENHYNQSSKLIGPYLDHTSLFDPLIVEIRMRRSVIYFETDKLNECLADTTHLLDQERLGESSSMTRVTVLKLHAKTLTKMGRNDEAKETLGKLSILCPEDQEITTMMKALNI